MPAGIVLHERDAFALDGLRDDADRSVLHLARFLIGSSDLVKIMTVDIDHVPLESLELLVDGIRAVDVRDRAVNLQIVVVHDCDQIIETVVSCEHCCLPYFALLDLAVTEDGIDSPVRLIHFRCQCHTHCS